jgi:hypothetical protein
MEILRIAENISGGFVQANFVIPEGDYPTNEFVITVTDLSDLSNFTITENLEATDDYTVNLSGRYDASYSVEIYSVDQERNVVEDTVEVSRPYVNPNTLGTIASEIEEYAMHEEIARAIIDSVIVDGFYYERKHVLLTGLGADYLPIWVDAKKLLQVYENNVLVYDVSTPETNATNYELTRDKSAITVAYPTRINRLEGAPVFLPAAASDLLDSSFTYRGFANSYDYDVVLEVGHTAVPSDIVRATKLLIEDIKCGKLEYYKRYISDYNTDQFKLKFDKQVFEGTGNILVDKILSKYVKSITTVGVI